MDQIADMLNEVLERGGPEVTWAVPEDWTVVPGYGATMYDGLVISGWVPADE